MLFNLLFSFDISIFVIKIQELHLLKVNSPLQRTMFHTQECRSKRLTFPIKCNRDDAWLGSAYYFWKEENDAINWGHTSKKRTGEFDVYSAEIDCKNILDTVFVEDHYNFFIEQIEKIAKKFIEKTNIKPDIKTLNKYLFDKTDFKEKIDGIMFQDIPRNDYSLVKNFYYKKRIQLAVYKESIISRFVFLDNHTVI